MNPITRDDRCQPAAVSLGRSVCQDLLALSSSDFHGRPLGHWPSLDQGAGTLTVLVQALPQPRGSWALSLSWAPEVLARASPASLVSSTDSRALSFDFLLKGFFMLTVGNLHTHPTFPHLLM